MLTAKSTRFWTLPWAKNLGDGMDFITEIFVELKSASPNVTHLTRPEKVPGLSYNLYGQKPTLFGDGVPLRHEIHCQVTIWSKDANVGILPEKVKTAMQKIGFIYLRPDYDLERHSGLYNEAHVFYIEFGG